MRHDADAVIVGGGPNIVADAIGETERKGLSERRRTVLR